MKRITLFLAALLAFSSVAYAASQVVYRPALSFTVPSNPYTSTGATTAPSASIKVIRLLADKDMFVNVGVTPYASASATAMFLGAYTPEYVQVGEGEQLAVISVSSTGTLYVTEMTQ